MKNKLWLGKEIEGKHKGDLTLFISGVEITFGDIDKALKVNKGIKQLYFGAGGCTDVSSELLDMCLKHYPKLRMTIELFPIYLELYEDYFDKVNFMFTVNMFSLSGLKYRFKEHQIKLQSLYKGSEKVLMVATLDKFEKVNADLLLSDKTYQGDVILK